MNRSMLAAWMVVSKTLLHVFTYSVLYHTDHDRRVALQGLATAKTANVRVYLIVGAAQSSCLLSMRREEGNKL